MNTEEVHLFILVSKFRLILTVGNQRHCTNVLELQTRQKGKFFFKIIVKIIFLIVTYRFSLIKKFLRDYFYIMSTLFLHYFYFHYFVDFYCESFLITGTMRRIRVEKLISTRVIRMARVQGIHWRILWILWRVYRITMTCIICRTNNLNRNWIISRESREYCWRIYKIVLIKMRRRKIFLIVKYPPIRKVNGAIVKQKNGATITTMIWN